jgi:ribosome maturation factor RimP
MEVREQIIALLEEKFQEEAFDDCFVVEVNQNNSKLEVFVDSDSNMTFQKCQKLSRYLEQHIEERGWMGEKYVLEVSSPGITRPLKFKRQYAKNIGRKMEIKTIGGEKYAGMLAKVDDSKVYLEEKTRVKEGKKKVNKLLTHEINFDQVEKATVKISFK